MRIAFWNIKRNNNIESLLISLIVENALDILILAEYNGDINEFCRKLNNETHENYTPVSNIGCSKISGIIHSRYKHEEIFSESRYEIIRVCSSFFSILIAMIHAPSKPHSDDYARGLCFANFYRDIEESEERTKTYNTIIIGDLNANPFDCNVISAGSLHGIPYEEEVAAGARVVQGRAYKMFYNPMWKFLSTHSPPYGTYYYNNSSAVNYYWNTFDQVLLRPSLLPALVEDLLEIKSAIGGTTLLKNGYKPNTSISDHLPILVHLQEEKIK